MAVAVYTLMIRMILRRAFFASLIGFCGASKAGLYDDFKGDAIDAAKWARPGSAAFFTQSNGRLHFPCKSGASESMLSTVSFPAGFFRLEFQDYRSTNASQAGLGLGSYLAIGLSAGDERVRTIRGEVAPAGYFEANYFRGDRYELWYFPASAASGQLGLYFDGSAVSFFYNAGLDPAKGWRKIGPTVTPKWPSLPKLYIAGNSGGSGCTRFSVVNVEHLPASLPAPLLRELGH